MLGIYIHFPFCVKKCPYCNFYSIKYSDELQKKYLQAVLEEIEAYKTKKQVNSIYLGGGTPCLVCSKDIEILLEKIYKSFNITEDVEITIELNPDKVDEQKFLEYKKIKINRLSFGVQSFNNLELQNLGRSHTEKTCKNIILKAKNIGFDNISVDLMIGVPFQTKKSLSTTLETAFGLNISHISLYQLKIEPKTKFFFNTPKNLPDDDTVCEFYKLAATKMIKAGFKQYEISNFAKQNKKSIHNLKYWKMEEYLGFGASAHSYYDNKRFFHESDILKYIENPLNITKEKTNNNFEWFILRLRLNEGIFVSELQEKNFWTSNFEKKVLKLQKEKLIDFDNNILTLTLKGMLLQNSIILFLLSN